MSSTSSTVDGVLPVDARVAGPERHLARSWVDEPSVLVIGLIRKRGGDLLNVDSGQVEHLLRLEPASSDREGCRTGRAQVRSRGGKTHRPLVAMTGDLAGGLRNLWDIDRMLREFGIGEGFWDELRERADDPGARRRTRLSPRPPSATRRAGSRPSPRSGASLATCTCSVERRSRWSAR